METLDGLPSVELVRVRRRITAAVFVAVALGTVGLFAAVTVAPLVAVELTGASTLSGVPTAAALSGTALGAAGLSRRMARRGRRAGLVLGFAVGAAGALVAVTAVVAGAFWLFVAGMLALGCGNGVEPGICHTSTLSVRRSGCPCSTSSPTPRRGAPGCRGGGRRLARGLRMGSPVLAGASEAGG